MTAPPVPPLPRTFDRIADELRTLDTRLDHRTARLDRLEGELRTMTGPIPCTRCGRAHVGTEATR